MATDSPLVGFLTASPSFYIGFSDAYPLCVSGSSEEGGSASAGWYYAEEEGWAERSPELWLGVIARWDDLVLERAAFDGNVAAATEVTKAGRELVFLAGSRQIDAAGLSRLNVELDRLTVGGEVDADYLHAFLGPAMSIVRTLEQRLVAELFSSSGNAVPAAGSRKRKKRGRRGPKVQYPPEEDKKLIAAWKSSDQTKEEFERRRSGLKPGSVQRAQDRVRDHLKRRAKRNGDSSQS